MRTVVLVHGWDGNPDNHWFPWLKGELERRKWKVLALQMPGGEKPELNEWLSVLNNNVNPDKQTVFIGHSLGCIAICRYLEQLPANIKIKGCIFVAGFAHDLALELESFTKPELNVGKIKEHCEKFKMIGSRDDDVVSLSKVLEFQHLLSGEIIIDDKKGHFTADDGVVELPSVLKALDKLRN
ncbi:serine hydrolase family protein [Candidatus Pacearchaeota archaeon]|nr:serine hydrolase family protein [Candidatus Pacearchaeota archaeon]